MTDSNRSLSELPGLVAERRRYEGWLAALDARRETTPGHVFERVQSDYRARLARVTEQLEAHRHVVEEERTNVRSRMSLLEAEERMRRDERAELDLRAHVGELAGDEAKSAFKAVDDSIQQLLGEKDGLQGRIDELAVLLEEREPTPPESRRFESPAAAGAPAPQATAPTVRPSAAPAPPIQAPGSQPAAARVATPPVDTSPAKAPAPQTSDASFDELAFLNTVVGAGDASQTLVSQSRRDSSLVRDDRPAALLAGLGDAKPGTPGEAPLAANVTGNNPITLRATVNEQTKTLKCNECGGMNYPTEWYCERCGAELAAV